MTIIGVTVSSTLITEQLYMLYSFCRHQLRSSIATKASFLLAYQHSLCADAFFSLREGRMYIFSSICCEMVSHL